MTKDLRFDHVEPTPEKHFLNRRQFLGAAGVCGAAAAVVAIGYRYSPLRTDDDFVMAAELSPPSRSAHDTVLRPGIARPAVLERFPAARNPAYDIERPLTDQIAAGTHNNFYEFLPGRAGPVWQLVNDYQPDPWTIEVTGQCRKPRTFDIDAMFKLFEQEERTYHFRCVERWAMDVPWTGFELNKLLKAVEPTADAKFVRFVSLKRDDQMPGVRDQPQYPWPYFEGLRMDEAMNQLTLMVTGVYGRPLPRQHGAPFRVIVPWKYGYKSPKAIVKIELVAKQPPTFWNDVSPREYGFLSNVNPRVPHPRWSQARERMLGTGETRQTEIYAGYGRYVAGMYG